MICVLVSLTDHLQYPSQFNPAISISHYTNPIKFKLPIVNDSIEYKNDKKKSDGYSLKDGKKSTNTKELKVNDGNRWNHVYVDGNSKKKVTI